MLPDWAARVPSSNDDLALPLSSLRGGSGRPLSASVEPHGLAGLAACLPASAPVFPGCAAVPPGCAAPPGASPPAASSLSAASLAPFLSPHAPVKPRPTANESASTPLG